MAYAIPSLVVDKFDLSWDTTNSQKVSDGRTITAMGTKDLVVVLLVQWPEHQHAGVSDTAPLVCPKPVAYADWG